jgi:hypothetical protein
MDTIVFRYRSRVLTCQDIDFIQAAITKHFSEGRSYISRVLCVAWNWVQPNGKLKEYAARDLLLRLEEKGFIFDQIPLFIDQPLCGRVDQYPEPLIKIVRPGDQYLWNYLLHHYHYLGLPKLVGEHIKHLAFINGQVVACLAWASAAWKVKARDRFLGWNTPTRGKNLYGIANNSRFLIPAWVQVKHLASKVLALSLRRLSSDWQKTYGHQVYLAETFVDNSRFKGTCYKAANWHYVGQTSGSAKKGNIYRHHGQPKAVYLYPLHRNFRRLLNDDPG